MKSLKSSSVLRPLSSVLMLLAACWALQVMSSATLRVWGDKFRLAQDRQRAEAFYKASSTIDPQNWHAPLGLGQIYSHYRYYELDPVKKEDWAQKERAAFAQAYRHNIKKEEIVYGLGRAELALGNRESGLKYLRQAAHYKRFNDYYWRKLGIELRKEGLYEEAMDVFLYAQKLDRSNKTVKRNIQWLREIVEREK
jgi:tetratricopeptide (TPR) repeat protein